MQVHYRTGPRSGVSIGWLGILILGPILLALFYAGILAAIAGFIVLAIIGAFKAPRRMQGVLLALAAGGAVISIGLSTASAGAAQPRTYKLGSAKVCNVGYVKVTTAKFVKVRGHLSRQVTVTCVLRPSDGPISPLLPPAVAPPLDDLAPATDLVEPPVPEVTYVGVTSSSVLLFSKYLRGPSARSEYDHVATTTTTFSAGLDSSLPRPADSAAVGTATITVTSVNPYYPPGSRTTTHDIVTCTRDAYVGAAFTCSAPNLPRYPWLITISSTGGTYTATDGTIVTLDPQTATWRDELVNNWPTMVPQ